MTQARRRADGLNYFSGPNTQRRAHAGAGLRKFSLLAHVPLAELDGLLEHVTSHALTSGKIIFQAGDPVLGMYFVQSGCIQIYRLSPTGQEQILSILQGGQVLAEWALFQGDSYPVSALCISDSNVLFLDRSCLLRLLARDPVLALKLLSGISLKLTRAMGLIEDLTLRDSRGRLCRYLSSLVGTRPDILLPTSQATLAKMLGITSETLSRTVKQLRLEGILERDGRRRLRVLDVQRLRQSAGEPEI